MTQVERVENYRVAASSGLLPNEINVNIEQTLALARIAAALEDIDHSLRELEIGARPKR